MKHNTADTSRKIIYVILILFIILLVVGLAISLYFVIKKRKLSDDQAIQLYKIITYPYYYELLLPNTLYANTYTQNVVELIVGIYPNTQDQPPCTFPAKNQQTINWGNILIYNKTTLLKVLTRKDSVEFKSSTSTAKSIDAYKYITEPFVLVLNIDRKNVVYYPFNMFNNKTKCCFNIKLNFMSS